MTKTTKVPARQASSPEADAVRINKANRIFFLILAAAFLTPGIVGIAVMYHLQLSGQPHLEWSEIPHHLYLLMPVIVSLLPFALLAWLAKARFLQKGFVERLVYGAFVGGEVGSITMFWQGWHNIEIITLAAISLFAIWIPIIRGMLVGSAIGWLMNAFWPTHRTLSTQVPKSRRLS